MESKNQTNGITLLPCPFCGAEPEPINHGEHMFFDHDDACHFEVFKRARSVAMVPDEIAAWNTRATHGTLTAEQVREAWTGNLKRDCLYDPPIPDWQAIADELNNDLSKVVER